MTSIAQRYRFTRLIGSFAAATAMVVMAGCKNLDVGNLNGANQSSLEDNPTAALLVVAAQSLVTGSWRSIDAGHATNLTKYGYEMWSFRSSEPRGLTDVVSSPITGGSWSYGTIKNINLMLDALTKIPGLPAGMSDADKAGMRGWLKMNLAIQLEDMAQAHDSFGVALTLQDDPLSANPAPINTKAEVWAKIFSLMDEAFVDLLPATAGTALPLKISAGFAGFNTPATLRTVNRALVARWRDIYSRPYVAADWDLVLNDLTGSFINPADVNTATASLISGMTTTQMRAGPFHVYEATSTNGLNSTDRFVNSRIAVEAQCKVAASIPASHTCSTDTVTSNAAGTSIATTPTNRDGRVYGANARVQSVASGSGQNLFGVTSTFRTADFLNPVQSARISTLAPLPAIRNEELLLIRAEAYMNKGDCATAIKDINRVRTSAIANLLPITCPYVGDAALNQPLSLEDELLYEKRLSLWGETGTVWLDMRHYGKATLIPHWVPEFRIFDIFPIPQAECDIRGYTTKGCFQTGYPGIQGGPNTKFQPLQ